MSDWLILVLYIFAVMRVTRLINYDTIMSWLHTWAAYRWGPGSWQVEFIGCPWCIGMWVALTTAWAPLLFFTGFPWYGYLAMYLMIALTASMTTGLFSPLSSEDDMEFEPVKPKDSPS